MAEQRTNWAGNYTFTAARIHNPTTLEQVQELVSQADKIRVLGSGHSFNHIADSPGDMLSLANFDANNEPVINRERRTATVGGGVKYGQLCEQLDREGFALHNLASLPHISIAGACATATHGSGDHNGNLATVVTAIELIKADGTLQTLSHDQDGEQFAGAVVGLGGLGVVTRLTLNLVPRFEVRQNVYENLSFAQLERHFDQIMSHAYSVSLFTDWQNEIVQQVWVKRRVEEGESFEAEPELFGARLATVELHPIRSLSAVPCTPQLGVAGAWYSRLPHFKMEFTPSAGEELQSEFFVPREQAVSALQAVTKLAKQIGPLLQISEIRTVAADDLWMSPCYQQARVGIHFTWKKDWEGVRQLLPVIENELEPFGVIPHWGKLFTIPAARVQSRYARLADFQRLLAEFDPQGKFRNSFLDTYIFGV